MRRPANLGYGRVPAPVIPQRECLLGTVTPCGRKTLLGSNPVSLSKSKQNNVSLANQRKSRGKAEFLTVGGIFHVFEWFAKSSIPH